MLISHIYDIFPSKNKYPNKVRFYILSNFCENYNYIMCYNLLLFPDNPLNCDCLMAGFARWLREANNLTQVDKSAAACATPPHLEGALISRLSKNKLCDDYEPTEKTKELNYANKMNSIVTEDKTVELDNEKDMYVDTINGLDDDLYDEELEVPSEDDLPISQAKVSLKISYKYWLRL